ncbi:MAG: beta-lactamase family protein [Spirochaetes bacterium]|nr:beta-lactamase family protein [Spirochaetota bacterium]MBU0954106.1 beta-lactamase family protein [Spirochaetota bacterium]
MDRTIKAIILFAALLLIYTRPAVRAEDRPPVDKIDQIMKDCNIPGAALVVFSANEILSHQALGWADYDRQIPVTDQTAFRVASITKSFTALGLLLLAEQGYLSLNTKVSDIAPEVEIKNPWQNSKPVRIVHLLEHSAGFNELHFNDTIVEDPFYPPLSSAIEKGTNSRRLRWPPGTLISYSSSGYALAGYLMEKVTGRSYEELVGNLVLNPLGMNSSGFKKFKFDNRLMALGYSGIFAAQPWLEYYARPAGSLICTAGDLASFGQMLLRDATGNKPSSVPDPPFPSCVLALMRDGESTGKNLPLTGGLGLGKSEYRGFIWYGHKGADLGGYTAVFGFSPELDRGYVLLTNYYDLDFQTGIVKLENLVRDFIVANSTAQPRQPAPEQPVAASQLAIYTGYYQWQNPPQKLVGWLDSRLSSYEVQLAPDGKLTLRESGSEKTRLLIPTASGMFRFENRIYPTVRIDPAAGTLEIGTEQYARKIRLITIILNLLLFAALLLPLTLLPVYPVLLLVRGCVWIKNLVLRKKHRVTAPTGRKALPLRLSVSFLSSLLLWGSLGLLATQPMLNWGQPTLRTVQFFFTSLLYAATCLFLAAISIKALYLRFSSTKVVDHQAPDSCIQEIYTNAVILAQFTGMLFLGYHGIIGLQLWQY